MFFHNITSDPVYYFTVVFCLTLSIVLHELGHGFAAIQQGDDTPIATGHMTWNPLVHMGPMGLGLLNIVLFLFNLIPIAPLDGSVVAGNFVPAYRSFIRNAANAKYGWIAFGLVFLLAGRLFELGADVAGHEARSEDTCRIDLRGAGQDLDATALNRVALHKPCTQLHRHTDAISR
jgi:Zn-dependent protease